MDGKGAVGVLCLVVLLLVDLSSARTCIDTRCFGNNQCPGGTIFNQQNANVDGGSRTCPPSTTCCMSSNLPDCNTTQVATCCQSWMMRCSVGCYSNNWLQINGNWVSNAYSVTYPTTYPTAAPNQCTTMAGSATCPPNYNLVSTASTGSNGNCNFCTPNNCFSAAGADCTTCTVCMPGFRRVSDGSCQPPPQMVFSNIVWGTNTPINVCSQRAINLTTDPGLSTAAVRFDVQVSTAAMRTFANSAATITSSACLINNVPLVPINTGGLLSRVPISFNFSNSTVFCFAVDSNGVSTNCSSTVTVLDLEPPTVTCLNTTTPTFSSSNFSFFNWSAWMVATDNVGVAGRSCVGGPADNRFPFNNQQPVIITCSAWDVSRNSAPCVFTVTVVDSTPPNITCPRNQTANTTLNGNTAVSVFAPVAADNVGLASVTCSPASGTAFGMGNNLVSCVATDTSGNPNTCTFVQTVLDFQPPVLSCPLTVLTAINTTSALSTITLGVSATDNSQLPVTLTCTPGGFPSAFGFPLGNTTVNCTATDTSNNVARCSILVTAVDVTPPTITCPPMSTVTLPSRSFGQLANGYTATAADNVAVAGVTCTPANSSAGFNFTFGFTSVFCTAFDTSGNNVNCTFPVTVTDNQDPQVTCPLPIATATALSTNIVVNFTTPTARDNVAIARTVLTVTINSVDMNISSNASSYNFSSSTSSAVFVFRAFDSSGRTRSCQWPITLYPQGQTLVRAPPTIFNCSTPFSYNVVPPDTFFPPSDINNPLYNNVTVLNFTTVLNQPTALAVWPTITAAPADPSVPLSVSTYFSAVSQPAASLSGLFPSSNLVIFGASDRQGNSAYCAFKVNVFDTQPPSFINCPSSQTYNTDANSGAVPSLWPSIGIQAIDNLPMANPFGTCTSTPSGYCPAPGTPLNSTLPVGVYSFQYTAVDTSGNQATPCTFSVTIRDNWPPVFWGINNNLINVLTDPGKPTANISNACPKFTVTDNVGVASVTFSSFPAGYSCDTPIPITSTVSASGIILTVTAADAAGNLNQSFIVVTVKDKEAPVLAGCNTSVETLVPVNTDINRSLATVVLPNVTATDNSGTVMLNVSSFPVGFVSGSSYPLGDTSVTFTAQDPYNNKRSCSFKVKVTDVQPPYILNFPGGGAGSSFAISAVTDPGLPTSRVTLPNIAAVDNVQINSAGFFPVTFNPGQTYNFSMGVTQLTYSAVDTSLNKAVVSMSVTVTDNQPPIFTNCPSTANAMALFTRNNTPGRPTAPFSWTVDPNDPQHTVRPIVAVDNVDGTSVQYTQFSSPTGYTDNSQFRVGFGTSLGNTTIIIFATDSSGNRNNCTFMVRVLDVEPPVLNCPGPVSLFTPTPYVNYALVEWRDPIISDNFFVEAIITNYYSGNNFTVGSYNVTYSAWDPSFNNASCTFPVTVFQMPIPTTEAAGSGTAEASSSGSSATTFAAAGAGGVFGLLILVAIIVVLMRRNSKRKLQAAQSGYAELMAMSDDFILERARAIQTALMESRQATAPTALTATVIHPERKYAPPPAGLAELMEYMRNVVMKEIPRESLEFGAELGSGEFGAVCEGFYLRPPPEDKLKVAIKTLRKATSDDDKARFLKEAAIMAQFNHPNIVSLTGVCTLPAEEPTLIVLEYMHLGSLHGYLQSPMVKDQLETLTMIRMALDVSQAMAYLAEAGFVHRDLAARNVLLDKTMTCRVGDFGLSVDLASTEADDGLYSGSEGAKIPIRWTAIEAVVFRQFSTASDVWSYGILLWEIWSYADMPYKGWNNKKVTEEVGNGYRMPKPAGCPDEVYRIMIECWNKNVKRRITFPRINEALVQAWNDIMGDSDDPNHGGLYDNHDPSENNTLAEDLNDSSDEEKEESKSQVVMRLSPVPDAVAPPPADAPDEIAETQFNSPKFMETAMPVVSATHAAEPEPEPEPERQPTPPPAPAPAPVVAAESAAVTVPAQGGTRHTLSEADIGRRVMVVKFGAGVLRFFGPHHVDGKPRCGVELDDAIGLNNGTVKDHVYFVCAPKHGVLVDPRSILMEAPQAASLMLNPIYDDSPAPASAVAAARAAQEDEPSSGGKGYLSIEADEKS